MASEQILNDLAEDYLRRLRQGDSPSIEEYVGQYPQMADEIEEFLESIALLEDIKIGADPSPKRSMQLSGDFGRYKILRSIGEGGMGTVYLAHDRQLDRKVALKTPKFSSGSDEQAIKRFYREARAAANLRHPNLCPVYDVGEIEGVHYISMAFIDGHPLSAYIRSRKQTIVSAAVRVIAKIATAVHDAHCDGVVHRDLKPANVMIDQRGEPIVMDFGLARQFGRPEGESSGISKTTSVMQFSLGNDLTQTGTVLGSPGYMSPEQMMNEVELIGPATDIYSLGVVLFELLTGLLPFQGDGSVASVITAVLQESPPSASSVRDDVDSQLSAIIQKAMAKKVEDRFKSAAEFANALLDYLRTETDSEPSEVPQPQAPESPALIRAKEQCELARSLFKDSQFAAAVSILEKMASDTKSDTSEYTQWAQQELPRVKSRAAWQTRSTKLEPVTATLTLGDSSTTVADENARPIKATDNKKRKSRRLSSRRQIQTPMWLVLVSVGLLVAIFAAIGLQFAQNGGDQSSGANTIVASQVASEGGSKGRSDVAIKKTAEPDAASTAEQREIDSGLDAMIPAENGPPDGNFPRPPRPGMGRPRPSPGSFGLMLQRLDANDDRRLTKQEIGRASLGNQETKALKQLLFSFEDIDTNEDDYLDEDEVHRFVRERLRSRIGRR